MKKKKNIKRDGKTHELIKTFLKHLKAHFTKDDIQKSHTIIQMDFDRKQTLESKLSELEAKRYKMD